MSYSVATEHVNNHNKFVLFSFVSCMVPFSVHHTPVVMVCAESAARQGSEVISVVFCYLYVGCYFSVFM